MPSAKPPRTPPRKAARKPARKLPRETPHEPARTPPHEPPRGPPRIASIGYEGRDLDGLVDALKAARIETLVDVRELPLSRKKGMSKRPLREALEAAGITYHHLRALGAPRGPRHALRATKAWPPFSVAYQAHLDEQQEAIEELLEVAQRSRTAVLCYEADNDLCHRGILLRRIGADIERL